MTYASARAPYHIAVAEESGHVAWYFCWGETVIEALRALDTHPLAYSAVSVLSVERVWPPPEGSIL